MEVIRGWTHSAFAVDEPSGVGEARRHAAQLALRAGFDELHAGRLALVVTELGTNLARHARGGQLLIAARPHALDVEVLSIDRGPGMVDIARSMEDGHSSGSTPGTGLGAVRRLSDEFELHSTPAGTVCLARVRHAADPVRENTLPRPGEARFRIGAVCLPAPGESVCGDAWSAVIDGPAARLLLADGLGHGPEAHAASTAATACFERDAFAGLADLVRQIHVELQTTRGAAVCVAAIDAERAELGYCGAGNIAGRVVSGVFDKSLLTQHGTAGMQIRRPEPATIELPPHGLV
ncbi:MAG: histidine kinase, partial [Comamonadaceae bacterium]